MKNVFFIDYMGTKYQESRKQLINYDFTKYKTVVECFGGSFGFSRFLYKFKNMKDTEYIIYDADKKLIELYQTIQTDPKKYLDEYHLIREDLLNKFGDTANMEKYKITTSLIVVSPKMKEYLKNTNCSECVQSWILRAIENTKWNKLPQKRVDEDFMDMIQNIKFIHNSFNLEELEKYDKETTLIYLDPPYLSAFNATYQVCGNNNIFVDIQTLLGKYEAMFVHSFDPLLDYFLKDYSRIRYPKRYNSKGGQIDHLIYSNMSIFNEFKKEA